MSIARVVEITATSEESFEDAMRQGIARATQTLRNVRSAWIKEQEVSVDQGDIVSFKVNMLVTFVLDESDDLAEQGGGQEQGGRQGQGGRQAARGGAKRRGR